MPPRKSSKRKTYTQAEKLAYYKKLARKQYGGRGAYTKPRSAPRSAAVGSNIGKSIGAAASYIPGVGAIAAPVLSWLGDKVGGYLGNKLGTYMGWGDYKVNVNSLTIPEGNSPASMHNTGQTTRICHREYIGDILSSSSAGQFKLQSFPLQPGASEVFPWLSDLAVNFQKYRFLGAIVEFKSASGDAITGTNTALGEIIISTNYNNADPNFANRNQMENTQYCSSAKPSVSFVHIIECDPDLQAQEMLYVSPSVDPEVGLTPNEINWCNVQVASIGCQGTNVNLGSLYITYEIELVQPVELSIYRGPSGDWFEGTGGSGSAPFGSTDPTPNAYNTIGGTCTTDTYTFPDNLSEGLFLCVYHCVGTAATILPPNITVGPLNMAVVSVFSDYTTPFWSAPQNGLAGTTNYTFVFAVKIVKAAPTPGASVIVLDSGTLPTAQTTSSFYVNRINSVFLTPTELEAAKDGEPVPMPAPQWDLGTADTEKQIELLRQKLKLLELQKQIKDFDVVTPQ